MEGAPPPARPPLPPFSVISNQLPSYLCHCMLTCDIPMTHNDNAGRASSHPHRYVLFVEARPAENDGSHARSKHCADFLIRTCVYDI